MRAKNTLIKQIKFDKKLKENVLKKHKIQFAKSNDPIERDLAHRKVILIDERIDTLRWVLNEINFC